MDIGRGRVALVVAAFGVSLVGAFRATATPAGPFEALESELISRRENDFQELPLSREAKRQQKAVLKCLELLDAPAEDIGDDFSTFVAVSKTLEKAYPEANVGAVSSLLDMLWNVRGALIEAFEEDLADLGSRIGMLAPSRWKDKAGDLHGAATEASHTGIAGAPVSTHAKLLVKAWKSWIKADALAGKGTVLPAPSMTFSVDGTPYTAGEISWRVETDTQAFELTGSFTEPETGNVHNVRIKAVGVTGPGTYSVISNPYSQGYWWVPPSFLTEFWSTDESGGTVTLTALDVEGGSASGTFTFTATGGPSETQVTVTGTFTATWNLTVEEGMGS
jgi:hypothetical protein